MGLDFGTSMDSMLNATIVTGIGFGAVGATYVAIKKIEENSSMIPAGVKAVVVGAFSAGAAALSVLFLGYTCGGIHQYNKSTDSVGVLGALIVTSAVSLVIAEKAMNVAMTHFHTARAS